MVDLLSTGKNKKNISVKYLLLTFFVCISMVAWLGISDLRADVDDPEDNTNEIEKGFQNTTQEQHADNISKEAAFQGHTWSNKDEYDIIVGDYTDEVLELRLSGMGWGEIVHYINREYNYDIHPSVLGLGNSKISSEETAKSSKHSSMQSGNNQGQGLALGHSKDNNSNRGGDHGGGNGGGNGGGKGGGKK